MLAGENIGKFGGLLLIHQSFPFNTLKCNGKRTQFAKVLSSKYTSIVISPKFHPANILRYTVGYFVRVQNNFIPV